MLDGLGTGRFADLADELPPHVTFITEDPDLDELVALEVRVDLAQHFRGQSGISNHHDGPEMVGPGTQCAALAGRQFWSHVQHVRHRAKNFSIDLKSLTRDRTSGYMAKTSKAWMREHVTDPYVKRATAEGYRSRAAYKLQQIDAKDRLLQPGMTVVDLGAAPGGWSQVAAKAVGPKGRVIAVDVLEMAQVPGVTTICGDFAEDATLDALERVLHGAEIDLVISDMAPNMSGIASADQARAIALAELAADFASKYLKPRGNLLVKTFQGAGYEDLVQTLRRSFLQVLTRKPDASRSRSSEVYLLCKGPRKVGSRAADAR